MPSARVPRVTRAAPPERPAQPSSTATLLVAAPEMLAAGVAAAAVLLVLLVDLAAFTTALAVTLAVGAFVVVAGAVWMLARRTAAVPRAGRFSRSIDLLALLAGVVWIVGNAHYSSQHLVLDRDPAIYNTAAQWLVHHRSLAAVSQYQQFGTPVETARQGWSTISDVSHYYPQGMHGVVALAALVGRVFGSAAVLKANVVLGGLGLLAFYSFARTVVPRGWALLAMVALGCVLPQIHFSRDTYSEPLGQLAVWVGLSLFARARSHDGWWPYALVGFVFGASMTSRVDAFLGFVPVLAMAVVVAGGAVAGRRLPAVGRVVLLLVATVLPFVVGLIDLRQHSGTYYIDLHANIFSVFKLDVATAVVAVIAVGLIWWGPIWRLALRWRRPLGLLLALALVVLFAGLALRPVVESHHGVDSNSVTWLGYYGGPVTVFLGLVGVAEISRRCVASGRVELLPLLGLVLPVTVGYLLHPDISPDQIWAERRFLPVVWPALLLGVALLLAELVRWGGGAARRSTDGRSRMRYGAAAGVAGAVGIATVAVPLVVTAPLLRVREYTPDLRLFQQVCSTAGPHAALLIVDGSTGDVTGKLDMPALLSYCNVPTAWTTAPTAATLATSEAALAAQGRQLWVVTREPDAVTRTDPSAALTPTIAVTSRVWEKVLTRAPKRAFPQYLSLYAGRVSADGDVTFVGG